VASIFIGCGIRKSADHDGKNLSRIIYLMSY
jgi:hypothetical protein